MIHIAETPTPCREVYYLPGRGGRIETGLGQGLLARGVRVSGRETFGAFAKLGFEDQVQAIRGDLQDRFWTPDGLVIANSYGAYLFCMPSWIWTLFLVVCFFFPQLLARLFTRRRLRAFIHQGPINFKKQHKTANIQKLRISASMLAQMIGNLVRTL